MFPASLIMFNWILWRATDEKCCRHTRAHNNSLYAYIESNKCVFGTDMNYTYSSAKQRPARPPFVVGSMYYYSIVIVLPNVYTTTNMFGNFVNINISGKFTQFILSKYRLGVLSNYDYPLSTQ
jgi:hypothetical protein